MSAEHKVVDFKPQSNGHVSDTNVGSNAHFIETFPWRPEGEGKAPIQIKVRPHVLKQSDLAAIDAEVEKTTAARQLLSEKRSKLIEKRVELEAELFIEREIDGLSDDESEALPKLNKVNTLLVEVEKDLETAPTGWEKRAELFFVPVVAEWPLTYINEETDQEELIPIKAKAIATLIDPVKLTVLHNDMQRFLFRDRSKKRK